MKEQPKIKIITFYSYKGGVGRTQLAANLATYLSVYQNKRILLVDWDLEAPGIDVFFNVDRSKIKKGLIDLFLEFMKFIDNDESNEKDLPKLSKDHIINCINSEEGGRVDLVPAGKYDGKYSLRVNDFNWRAFYEDFDGKYYIESLKRGLNNPRKERYAIDEYDYVFIDSRTGVSDYSGICNVHLPDINIIIVAPNAQNFNGSFETIRSIHEAPYVLAGSRSPIIMPILSRVIEGDNKLTGEWIAKFKQQFKEQIQLFLWQVLNRSVAIQTRSKPTSSQLESISTSIVDEYIDNTCLPHKNEMVYGENLLFEDANQEFQIGQIQRQYIEISKILEDFLDVNRKSENAIAKAKVAEQYDSIPKILTPKPFNPIDFIGRERELKAIQEKLSDNANFPLLLINGVGGVGKTALAARYFHQFLSNYHHLAWIIAEESISSSILYLANPLNISFDKNTRKEEKLSVIISALSNLPAPSLLVIDGGEKIIDLQTDLSVIHKLVNFHILFTTRIRDADLPVSHLVISGMPEEESMELFRLHYPSHRKEDDVLLKKFVLDVDCNPLLIELFAKNLRELNRFKEKYSLEQLLSDMDQSLVTLSESQPISTIYQAKGTGLNQENPAAIILAMYDVNSLGEEEKQIISLFAVLPEEPLPYDILDELLGEMAIDEAFLTLAKKGWIEFSEVDKTFKVHKVVQDVVRYKQKERLLTDCHPLLKGLIKALSEDELYTLFTADRHQHGLRLVRFAQSIQHRLSGSIDEDLGVLSQRVGNYYTMLGDLIEALSAYQQMCTIFKTLTTEQFKNANFKNSLAISYEKLGSTHTSLGNLDRALEYFEERSRLGEELYAAYPQNVGFKNSLAISYEKLGSTHTSLGNLDRALEYFEERSRLGEELYAAYPQNVGFKNGLAISYEKLGSTHTSLGNLDRALEYFEERSRLGEELYAAYPQNVGFKNGLAISYSKLGSTHTSLGNLDRALEYFEKDIELSKELYTAYPQNVSFKNDLANSYSKLGDTHISLGNVERALECFENSTKLFEELYSTHKKNMTFKDGLVYSYMRLGKIHITQKSMDFALEYLEYSSFLGEELYKDYQKNIRFKLRLAMVYSNKGDAYFLINKPKKAIDFLVKSNIFLQELYSEYSEYVVFKSELALSFYRLGHVYQNIINDNEVSAFYYKKSYPIVKDLVKDISLPIYNKVIASIKRFYKEELDEDLK